LKQIESAVEEIGRYLVAHPNASDTAEGVRDWWIGGQRAVFSLDVVQAALDRLVEAHMLECRSIPGGVLYTRVTEGRGE
jgi:hypothetical protein